MAIIIILELVQTLRGTFVMISMWWPDTPMVSFWVLLWICGCHYTFRYNNILTTGHIKAVCEPWDPPGLVSEIKFTFTLSTAFQRDTANYLLGVFEVIDPHTGPYGNELFKAHHDARSVLPPLHEAHSGLSVPHKWFTDAFTQLPVGTYLSCSIVNCSAYFMLLYWYSRTEIYV